MSQRRRPDHRHSRASATERKRRERELRRLGLKSLRITIDWIATTELLIEKNLLLACDCDDPGAVRQALEQYLTLLKSI
jgi:hypothetical protein